MSLQGFRPLLYHDLDLGPPAIRRSLPGSVFPLGVNHEFICPDKESLTASIGFIAGILSSLMKKKGLVFWISATHRVFPPALVQFGIDPARIIFIHIVKEKEILWAMEEALKCEALAAVVGELSFLDLTQSRRLQLATEQSCVTGFILRCRPRILHTTASVCRWHIRPLGSETENGLPGIGYPRWQVDLLKVRNGKPGSWSLEWVDGKIREISERPVIHPQLHQEAG